MYLKTTETEIIAALKSEELEGRNGATVSSSQALAECEKHECVYLTHEEENNIIHISFTDPTGEKHAYAPQEVFGIVENRLKGRERASGTWD